MWDMNRDEFTQRCQELTPQRRSVLLLMLRGYKDREISAELHAASGTIRKHVQNLCDHFGIDREVGGLRRNRRRDLIALARQYESELLSDRTLAIVELYSTIVTRVSGLEPNKKIWRYLRTLTGHSDIVKSVAISSDGETLATGSLDQTIKLWNLATGELLNTLTEHTGGITCVTFSSDGQTLASSSSNPDGTIKLWDTNTGKLKNTLKGDDFLVLSVWSIAISPDDKILVSGHHADSTVKVWDLNAGKLLHTLRGHVWAVHSVAISPDGKIIASGSFDNNIKIWNAYTGELRRTLNGPESPLNPILSWFSSDSIYSVAFSPDGLTLASGGTKQPIILWCLRSGEQKSTLTGHSEDVYSVAFSPDGKLLASGSADRTIRIWDVSTGEPIDTLEHSDTVYSVAFSPDGQMLVGGSKDGAIKVWQLS